MSDGVAPLSSTPRTTTRAGFVLLVALVALVPVGKAVLYDTLDPDSFIHLLAAEQMWREGVGPIVDHQSYMSVREPWTPYSWLAEFAMLAIWNAGGFRAALLTHALLATSLVALYALTAITRQRCTSSDNGATSSATGLVRAAVATASAAFLTIPYLSFRPVTMALVVMATIVWLLVRDRARGERTRAIWVIVPLTALLINLHLYAIIVPAWIGALWAGALWEAWRAGPDARPEGRRRLMRYTLLGAAAAAACLATPMLPGTLRSIAFYQRADVMVAGSQVKEYLPVYAGGAGKAAAALVLVMLACAAWRRRELRAGEVCWLIVSVVLLMRMGRFSPVFAMAAAPMFAATMPRFRDRVLSRLPVRLALAAVLGVGVLRVVERFPWAGTTLDAWLERNGPDMPGYPADAARFVDEHIPPRTGQLINEYTWGGYLSWRLGPRFKVLLDGRTNLFDATFWQATYFSSPEQCAAFLSAIDADAAVLPREGSRFRPALESSGWTVAHGDDGRAVVMIPPPRSSP